MRIPPYNIISSIQLIVAQRLIRKLGEHCKRPETLPDQILLDTGFSQDSLKKLTLFSAQGSEHCTHGYIGRIGVYQVMPISHSMQQLILNNPDSSQLEAQCQSALIKVGTGITSLEEVNKITRG